MRRAAPAGVLLCSLISVLVGCGNDTPTSNSSASPQYATTAAPSQSCTPKVRPGKIVEKVLTPPAWGVAVRDDGLTYFAEPFSNAVGITSTTTRTIMGAIPTGDNSNPIGLAFSPDGATAYVTNLGTNQVGVIDVASAQMVATISTGDAAPFVVRVSAEGDQLFVATNLDRVLVVNTATREIIKTIEVGFAANGFAVHPDGRIMYVSAFESATVSEVDMFTGTVLRTFVLGGRPQEMAINRKGSLRGQRGRDAQ